VRDKLAQLLKAQQAPEARLANNEEQERVLEPVGLTSFYDNGYLMMTSPDGNFKYWLDGRVNLDFATFKGAENRLGTGAEIRRARIGVKATLYKNWLAEIDLDFADNAIEIKDMWMGYSGFANSVNRVGNHKAPFGLDTLTSSKNISFIERSYLDSWSPDRLLGISYSRWGRQWQFSGGIFGEAGGVFNDKDSLAGGGAGSSQGYSLVGRATVAPVAKKGRVLHVGFAAAHRTPDAGEFATSGDELLDRENASRLIKLSSRAGTHVSRAKFLSTGDMPFVKAFNQYGFEVLGELGPVNFQGEYQATKVNRYSTTVAEVADHSFSGYYAQVSWFITGERRPCSASEGEWGRLVPSRPGGALELALRYDTLDLNDITALDPIKGGSAKNVTVGLNWHINANHKLMFDVTSVNNDEFAKPGKDWAPLPAGTATKLVPVVNDDFVIIAARYQLAF
jgi:phosphate-selective porin OprO/OprP